MSELIQLVYASRSNLHSYSDPNGIEPGIGRILLQSRRNNLPRSIGGVLCFGDDHFFQCLEGGREEVEALYDTIRQDDRHRDVTLLLKRPIPQRRFKLWSMKYLSLDRDVRTVLKKHGLKGFDPYQFNTKLVVELLETLQKAMERQYSSKNDPHWQRSQTDFSSERSDNHPLAFLGVGALVAAIAAIVVFAFGLR
jgi:hypothetical protein